MRIGTDIHNVTKISIKSCKIKSIMYKKGYFIIKDVSIVTDDGTYEITAFLKDKEED